MTRRVVLLASALLASLALGGCVGLLNATVPTRDLRVTHDVAYGPLPRQRLDIYADTRTAGPKPVVVFLYGGSWRTGSKDIYLFLGAALARQGMVVVIPDYRLFPQVRYPDFIRDNAAAVAWVEHHAAALGGDGRRVVVMGHSAGAYDAAMIATDPAWLREAGGSRDALAGFVGLSGPYDFLPITDPAIIPIFPRDDPATMPVNHVDAHVPPTLLLTGLADRTVRPRNSRSLFDHIRAAGGRATLRLYPGTGHIGIILDLTPPFSLREPVLRDIASFIQGLPPRDPPVPAAPP